MPHTWLLLQAQAAAPDACLTGFCGAAEPWRALPSGVLFVAVGLVVGGGLILWRQRQR